MLAGIIIVTGYRVIDWEFLRRVRSIPLGYTVVMLATATVAVLIGFTMAILVGLALSEYVYNVTKSRSWYDWIVSNSNTGTLTNINAKK